MGTLDRAGHLAALAGFLTGAPPPPSFDPLLRHATRPAEALAAITELTRATLTAHPEVHDRSLPHRLHGDPPTLPQHFSDWQRVADLFQWLAELPPEIGQQIDALERFSPTARRAAEQEQSDAFDSLTDLIVDLWEHVLHPFTPSFDAITKTLLFQHRPQAAIDYGAGAGYFTFYLASLGCRVYALELNPVKQAFLRFQTERRGLSQRVVLSPPAEPVGCALAINLFDHLADASELVPAIAAALRPGGHLFYQALFPNDGWHTSDTQVIERTFVALHTRFEAVYSSSVQNFGLEILRKRPVAGERPLGADGAHLGPDPRLAIAGLRPRLHPSVGAEALEKGDGAWLLQSPLFWVRNLMASPAVLELVKRCDGSRALSQIVGELEPLGIDEDAVIRTVDRLWRQHLIAMLE